MNALSSVKEPKGNELKDVIAVEAAAGGIHRREYFCVFVQERTPRKKNRYCRRTHHKKAEAKERKSTLVSMLETRLTEPPKEVLRTRSMNNFIETKNHGE